MTQSNYLLLVLYRWFKAFNEDCILYEVIFQSKFEFYILIERK